MFAQTFKQLLVCLFAVQTCYAYQFYQQRIPNGEVVPHPCKANNIWKGVGHQNLLGGGVRNQFGVDFKNNGAVWDATICNMDSDNDGRTNGEELGDPRCEWTPGQAAERTTGLSHPGICEPLDSERCGPKPEWVNCKKKIFECDVLDEPETFNFTIRIPPTPVPAVETTYTCMFFELPFDQEYHMVAETPYIDNEAVMHHIIVYGCTPNVIKDVSLNTPGICNMGSGHSECSEIIATWTVGVSGHCLHPESGVLVGGARGYKYASFQFHWNNPELRSDYTDSSGMNIFLTPKLRPYNAGFLVIGQNYLEIPPGEFRASSTGVCPGTCTARIMTDAITVTAVGNHMHYLGRAQFTEVRRNDRRVSILGDDEVYSYDSPVTHTFNGGSVVIRPGDEIRTTCQFQSTSRTKTTYFGEETADEMCLSFLTYYPKENVQTRACVSWRSLDTCEIFAGNPGGCDLAKLQDPSNEDEFIVKQSIREKCTTTHCRQECKEYVKVLKSTNPCYMGDVYKSRQQITFENLRFDQRNLTSEELELYSRLNSCDTDLALESYIQGLAGDETTGGAKGLAASLITWAFAALVMAIP